MATLSFKNINKVYDNNVQAVFDFNLEVKDKEFIVFVGPSGCGKSTTLRMIAGLEDITNGQLFIDGVFVNNVVPKDRNIAMVFQSYALYPHMTVFDNMAFALKLRKVKMPDYEENEEVNSIMEDNKNLLVKIRLLNKEIKKKNEPAEILKERDEIFEQILVNINKAQKLLVQKVGINELEIKENTELARLITLEISKTKKKIVLNEKQIEKLKAFLEKNTNDKKLETAKAEITKLENANKIFNDSLIQKNDQLEETIKKVEYYEKTEVPLTVLRKHTRFEIFVEVYKTAQTLDLARYLYRKPAALSGGQRQRVALGRAIVRKPKVFLMDEPLSNLDAKLRVQMRSSISKIHERVGATTVYVTHDQTEAMTMASRIVVMKDGYIQQIGTPKEVYNDPANMFVGGFIGAPAMNFLKGTIKGDKFVIAPNPEDKDSKEIIIEIGKNNAALVKPYDGNVVYMGARPEAIYLKGDITNSNPIKPVSLVCDFAELLGYELVLYTFVNGQKMVMKVSTSHDIKTHDNIDVCFNEKALYFFEETGKRIK